MHQGAAAKQYSVVKSREWAYGVYSEYKKEVNIITRSVKYPLLNALKPRSRVIIEIFIAKKNQM